RESPWRQRGARSGSRRRLLAVVEEVDAHPVERPLTRLKADGFAITREAHAALLHAAGMGERDVHRSDRFFLGSTARAGDTGDAHTKGASDAAANTVRERHGDFRAHRALGLNEFRRDARPRRLEIVAVANHSAEKIGGTACDARQPLS